MNDQPVVTPAQLVAVAMKHLGETWETDPLNGTHPVSLYCEATVEDWCREAGLPQPAYTTAAVAGDAGPLSAGRAPVGAFVYWRGSGWSVDDHVGLSLGDGRTISGLSAVTIADGWQDLPSYRGWRWPVGIAIPNVSDEAFLIPGNPLGDIPLKIPFWNRWHALDQAGLALPQLGYAKAAEMVTPAGRRVQQFERGWLGVQSAPDPWDVVTLMPGEIPTGD